MAKKKKLLFVFFGALCVMALFWVFKPFAIAPPENVNIIVISGEGGMPGPGFDGGEGQILENEDFTAVFTEPFSNLENWQNASEVKRVSTSSGKARMKLKPGRYGLYYIYRGEKVLYGNLKLANPRKDIIRDKQGPWFIKVHEIGVTSIKFSVKRQPS